MFFLSAVLTVPTLFFTFFIASFTIDVDGGTEIVFGLGIIGIIIAAACYVSHKQ